MQSGISRGGRRAARPATGIVWGGDIQDAQGVSTAHEDFVPNGAGVLQWGDLWKVVSVGSAVCVGRPAMGSRVDEPGAGGSDSAGGRGVQDAQAAGAGLWAGDAAWSTIQKEYVGHSAVTSKDLTYGAISGMVDALGDMGHSAFLTPEMARELRRMERGEFRGVGLELQMRDGRVVVVSPIDGSPAQKAGVKPGEVMVEVAGEDVECVAADAGDSARITGRPRDENHVDVRGTADGDDAGIDAGARLDKAPQCLMGGLPRLGRGPPAGGQL